MNLALSLSKRAYLTSNTLSSGESVSPHWLRVRPHRLAPLQGSIFDARTHCKEHVSGATGLQGAQGTGQTPSNDEQPAWMQMPEG